MNKNLVRFRLFNYGIFTAGINLQYTCLCELVLLKVRILCTLHTQRQKQSYQINKKSLKVMLENSYSGIN